MKTKRYSEEHFEQRSLAINERGYECEITGEKENIQAHHSQPRYLGGPDHKSNYILLEKDFHMMLHDKTWSRNPKLIEERSKVKKYLVKDPDNEQARKRLEEIDGVLMPEYIHKLINKLPHEIREKVVEATLLSSFCSVRDLTMQVLDLRKQVEVLQNGTKDLKEKQPRKKKKQAKKKSNLLPFKRR